MTQGMRRSHATISLIDGFSIERRRDQHEARQPSQIAIPARRVLAFLAIQGEPRARDFIAFTLWPESGEAQAQQCLRTALSDIRHAHADLIVVFDRYLGLAPGVDVDLTRLTATARALASVPTIQRAEYLIERFSHDILPDWYDDWLADKRARWQEHRRRALETLSERLCADGQVPLAIEAALASIASDPLREPARRALIRARLAEGDRARAVVEFRRFDALMRAEVGIEPSVELRALLESSIGAVA